MPTNRRIAASGEREPTARQSVSRSAADAAVADGHRRPPQQPQEHRRRTSRSARFVAVTGVSGSGKSSLVEDVLYNTLARKLHRARTAGAAHDEIRGLEQIDKVIRVDQDPLGNTPSARTRRRTPASST